MKKWFKKPVADSVLDDTVIEALAKENPPVAPPAERAAELRAAVMARVHDESRVHQADFHTVRADEGIWFPVARGVRIKTLYTDRSTNTRSFLLRLEPGASLPAHEHSSDEECIVLEGEARLGDITVRAGDYHLAPKGIPHGVVSSDTGALLFLRTRVDNRPGWVYQMMKHSMNDLIR